MKSSYPKQALYALFHLEPHGNYRSSLMGKSCKNGEPDLSPDLFLPATNKTMNIMKPGAQSKMLHAVGKPRGVSDKSQSEVRFSLSFRKINSAIKEDKAAATVVEDHPNAKADVKTRPKKNIILIAGDSFAARLKADLLGKGKLEVQNIAKGGRKLEQVQKDIEEFVKMNPDVEVKKLFVSVGANDIRYCQNGIKHLKNAVCDLMRSINTILPGVKAWFQSIPRGGTHLFLLNLPAKFKGKQNRTKQK